MDHILSQPQTPRQRRHQQRTDQFLHIAMGLIQHQGLDQLTLQAIAHKADYTPGALYRYFRSKDEIVASLQGKQIEKLIALQTAVETFPCACGCNTQLVRCLSPLTAANGFSLALLAFAVADPAGFGLLSLSLADPRTLLPDTAADSVLLKALELVDRIAEYLHLAAQRGDLEKGDSRLRAAALWTSQIGTLQLIKMERRLQGTLHFEPRQQSHLICRSLLRGWGASEQVLNRIQDTFNQVGLDLHLQQIITQTERGEKK